LQFRATSLEEYNTGLIVKLFNEYLASNVVEEYTPVDDFHHCLTNTHRASVKLHKGEIERENNVTSIVRNGFSPSDVFVKLEKNGIGYGFDKDGNGALIEAETYATLTHKWHDSYTVPSDSLFVRNIYTFEQDKTAPCIPKRQRHR